MNRSKFLFITLPLLAFIACSTTAIITDRPEDDPFIVLDDDEIAEFLRDELDDDEYMLFQSRSYLSDRFSSLEHDMPEIFLKEVSDDVREIDETVGYRVQILSTRNVAYADSIRDDFRSWSSDHIEDHVVDSYIFFRQPYYRVRVGDFRNRANAIEFSQMIKNRYPEAWVVPDRIEPDKIPAKRD